MVWLLPVKDGDGWQNLNILPCSRQLFNTRSSLGSVASGRLRESSVTFAIHETPVYVLFLFNSSAQKVYAPFGEVEPTS